MVINLNQLKVFHIAARMQSFTRAAEVLFLTQPGISKHIKDLEDYYGTRLFDRLGKKVVLTRAGEILYSKTEIIFNMIDQLKVEIDELQGLDRGTLNIGASITIGIYILPEVLSGFRSLYPHINIGLDIVLNRQVADKILDNSIDIGFLGAPVDDGRISVGTFMKDELALVLPAGHEWSLRDTVEPHELMNQTFIISRQGSGTRKIIEERLGRAGITLKNCIEFGHTEAVKRAVESGLGVSILSKVAIRREEHLGVLKSLPLKGVDLSRDFYFAYRKDKYMTNAAKAFLESAVYSRGNGAEKDTWRFKEP
ncbi:MAG: selenium metabolism-associated LysR family transcriptional regulator [Syntrophales bacterium]|nr:selenium metabolism-associated LysR family transcriptional regulator [Syntrophales bacterium]